MSSSAARAPSCRRQQQERHHVIVNSRSGFSCDQLSVWSVSLVYVPSSRIRLVLFKNEILAFPEYSSESNHLLPDHDEMILEFSHVAARFPSKIAFPAEILSSEEAYFEIPNQWHYWLYS